MTGSAPSRCRPWRWTAARAPTGPATRWPPWPPRSPARSGGRSRARPTPWTTGSSPRCSSISSADVAPPTLTTSTESRAWPEGVGVDRLAMAPRIDLVLDCADADALARFWAAALGYRPFGVAGNYRSLVPDEGAAGPKLILQEVDEAKRGKNRMHLDITAADIEAEADRLVALGATRGLQEPISEHGTRWIVMADPEGNEFCICEP